MALPPPFTIQQQEVVILFTEQNTKKSSGPEGMLAATPKYCWNELAPVFYEIMNSSLEKATVPMCFKSSKLIHIPKKSSTMSLDDYQPMALTSVVMKIYERFMLRHLKSINESVTDEH